MMTNKPSSQEIAAAVVEGRQNLQAIDLTTLADVNRILATEIASTRLKAYVIIYGLEARTAIVFYPLVSKTRLNIVSNNRLDKDQFKLALHHPQVIGDILPSSLRARAREERNTLAWALVIFLIAFLLLIFLANDAAVKYPVYLANPGSTPVVQNMLRFYEVVGQSLLAMMTLFLTVFLLFTISQNSDIAKDRNLYRQGLVHKYMRDDQYVARVAALSLSASALGLLLTAIPIEIRLPIEGYLLNKMNTIIPFLYAVATASFVISLASLSYYSKRLITAYESNLIKNLIDEHEALTEQHKQRLEQTRSQPEDNGHNGVSSQSE